MKNVVFVISAVILVIALLMYFGFSNKPNVKPVMSMSNDTPSVDKLPAGISPEQYSDAASWFKTNFPHQQATREAILFVLAERAINQSKPDVAVQCYGLISTATPKLGLIARLEQGKLLIKLNQADLAEAALREYLEVARLASDLQPQQVQEAFKWLTYILSVQLRQEERQLLLLEQHQIALADPLDSKQLFFPNLLILNSPAGKKKIAEFLKVDPKNLRIQVANARYRTLEGGYDQAIELLESLQREFPDDLTVAAALSEAYFENGDSISLDKLMTALPSRSTNEPWLLTRMRGELALEKKQWQRAIECFEQVLKYDPTNASAQMGIAKAWDGLGDQSRRQLALQRSAILAEIRVNLSNVQPNAENACYDLSEKCSRLGLELAAQTFKQHAKVISQQNEENN